MYGGDEAAAAERARGGVCAVLGAPVGTPLPLVAPPAAVLGYTEPPSHLTEGELLALMERHAIGTDASMASHVTNVQKRGYVTLDETTRRLKPSALGLALIHAYTLVDEGLVLPCVRASIEAECARVARGEAAKAEVVSGALTKFRVRYASVVAKAHVMPAMLAVALTPEGERATGASAARWAEAAAKVAAVNLDDLLDPNSPRVIAALRGRCTLRRRCRGGGGGALPRAAAASPGLRRSVSGGGARHGDRRRHHAATQPRLHRGC